MHDLAVAHAQSMQSVPTGAVATVSRPEPLAYPHPNAPQDDAAAWRRLLQAAHGDRPLVWDGSALVRIFGPLIDESRRFPVYLVGQLGQSLDGRIATHTGHSKYINGPSGLTHLHRLRALCDGVMVGVGTAVADDPLLTTRLVDGPSPARIVIDPRGRVSPRARLFNDDGVRTIVLTAAVAPIEPLPAHVEIHRLPLTDGRIAASSIAERLGALGLRRILVEGGASTLSLFLTQGYLHRLHMIVAPVILGDGYPCLSLPPIEKVDQALRPFTQSHVIGSEMLHDCAFVTQ